MTKSINYYVCTVHSARSFLTFFNTAMNYYRLRTPLVLVVLAGLLTTCVDHRIPDIAPGSTTLRQRVKTITQQLPNTQNTEVSSFNYDTQNRLASILTFQTPDSSVAPVELSVYQYDAQNRLTQLRREIVRRAPYLPSPVELYTLTYNALGQVSGLNYANGFSLVLNYNAANQLTSSSRNFQTGGLTQRGWDAFTFTGDNLTALNSPREYSDRSAGGYIGYGNSRTFTYDDRLNPFFGNYIIPAPYPEGFVNLTGGTRAVVTYFGGVDNALTLSPHNVLTEVISDRTTHTYQYQYNAANLPTVRTRTTNGVVSETLRFDYEGY